MEKVYHVYCDGFTKSFVSITETQAFIDSLRTKGCVGKEIVVNVGHGTLAGAIYDRKHERREILRSA